MIVFSTRHRIGEFALRPVRMPGDASLLHTWLTDPKSAFWMMTDASLDAVRQQFERVEASSEADAFLGLYEGGPAFLMERYDPAAELGEHYSALPGDVGMHFLVAPTDRPIHGFSRAVIRTVMAYLFTDPETERVVVEPDVRNTAVHVLNASVGFRVERTISLRDKDAYLSFCTRENYRAALLGDVPAVDRSG